MKDVPCILNLQGVFLLECTTVLCREDVLQIYPVCLLPPVMFVQCSFLCHGDDVLNSVLRATSVPGQKVFSFL